MWLILAFICFACSVVTYQDFKSRAVIWFIFPALSILGIAFNRVSEQSFRSLLTNSLVNVSFLVVQFILLLGYFYFKKSRGSIHKKIGWGDIFFLFACCFFFSPLNFILFYILSLVFSLLAFLTITIAHSKEKIVTSVPLAGLQSVFLLIFLAVNIIIQNNVTNDDWLLSYLNFI